MKFARRVVPSSWSQPDPPSLGMAGMFRELGPSHFTAPCLNNLAFRSSQDRTSAWVWSCVRIHDRYPVQGQSPMGLGVKPR